MTTRGRKHAHLTVAAGVATIALLLVACGNDTKPAAPKASARIDTSRTPGPNPPSPMKPSLAPGSPRPTIAPTPSPGLPTTSPTVAPPPKLTNAMLLTGPEVAKADPKRGWSATSGSASTPICGRASTRGDDALGNLSRNFTTDLDASGGQWLTRYADAKAARAAYEKILKTLKSCKAAVPAPTHARKITENRTLPLGDATQLVRWYDYPLPSDPGSEDGGFPYAVTRKGNIINVLAFRESGPGLKPTNFERLTRAAAAHLL